MRTTGHTMRIMHYAATEQHFTDELRSLMVKVSTVRGIVLCSVSVAASCWAVALCLLEGCGTEQRDGAVMLHG